MRQVLAMLVMAILCLPATGATEEESPWDNSVSLGLTLKSGNSESLTANGALTGERSTDKDLLRLGVQGNYGETEIEDERETTAQDAKFYAQYNRNVTDRLYWLVASSIEYDDIAGVDYRLTVGPGFGVYVVKNDKITWGIDVGPTYIKEDMKKEDPKSIVGAGSEDKASLRATERLDYKISENAKVWQSVEYLADVLGDEGEVGVLSDVSSFEDYLLNVEIGAEAALVSSLSVRVVVQDKYDNEPAPGRKHNDIALITSLVWKF